MSDLEIIRVPGHEAPEELRRLYRQSAARQQYPVLFGDEKDYETIREGMDLHHSPDPAAILSESHSIDPVSWFDRQLQDEVHALDEVEGDWPDGPADTIALTTHQDILTSQPKKEVLIGLFKGSDPWEIFATLKWGGWNDCPFPAEHCAIQRRWASLYGAQVVSITGDVVQCFVAQPPEDRQASLRLAREQFAYCYDLVAQGTQTISALAKALLHGNTWYFWWD